MKSLVLKVLSVCLGHEIERIEGEDKTNPRYVQFQWNTAGLTFENWQVSHFRILGNDKFSPYRDINFRRNS